MNKTSSESYHLSNLGCNKIIEVHHFWSNYSDLTRPHPKWWLSKGNPLISGKSRLVKYNNLTRSFGMFWISAPPPLCHETTTILSRWRPGVEGTAQTYHPAWCERYQGKGGKKRFEASFASHSVSWCSTTKTILSTRYTPQLVLDLNFNTLENIWSRIKSWLFRKG